MYASAALYLALSTSFYRFYNICIMLLFNFVFVFFFVFVSVPYFSSSASVCRYIMFTYKDIYVVYVWNTLLIFEAETLSEPIFFQLSWST